MPSSVLIKNFSDGGFYFEVSSPLDSGESILVRSDDNTIIDPVGSGTWTPRLAEIKWCMEVGTGKAFRYGCGAKYVLALTPDFIH